jgi:hypothetical protein
MFIVFGPYVLLGLLLAVGFAVWAGKVGYDHHRHLDPDLRREVVIGLVIISLLAGPVGVIAAYLSKPAAL